MFCKHDWKLISETTTKSKYENAIEVMKGAFTGSTHLPWQLCDAERKYIQIVGCTKCGKLKRFVENI